MTALAWFMGGIFLGLLVMAVVQFIDLLLTPFTVATHALFAMESAERQSESERRRIEVEVRRWKAQAQIDDARESQP